MARKCAPNIAIEDPPDFGDSIFVQGNLDPNTIVFDDMDLGCTAPRSVDDPTPSLEGYWDRNDTTGTLFPKQLSDYVMVGKTAQSYDEQFGVSGKIYTTGGYMLGPGNMTILANDSTTLAFNIVSRNSVYIKENHMRGTQANAWMLNTISPTTLPSTPPYTFYTDTDTGMYRPAADSLGFAGGGSALLVLNANGSIQIPTAPATAVNTAVPFLSRNTATGILEQTTIPTLHSHTNKAVLDLLTAPAGALWYNGSLVFDPSPYYTSTQVDAIATTLQNDINNRSLVTHNHALFNLSERSYTSLTDQPDLSDLHDHNNKPTLDRIADYDGAGVTARDVLEIYGAGTRWTKEISPNAVQFRTGYTPSTEPAGLVWWNDEEMTINVASGQGPVLQVGHETYILIYNDTGVTILNGQVLRPVASTVYNGLIVGTVELARADVYTTCSGTLMVASHDIPTGTTGLAARFGRARDVDTSGLTAGETAYLSPTVAGGLTNTRPSFPNYQISMGAALSSSTSGEFITSVTQDISYTFHNFWNGVFRESFDFRVSSNGTVVTGSLTPSNGNVDMTMIFSDGFSLLDTDPSATITLTAGTDSVPQRNYVYVPFSTKALTVSTSSWPITEHIRVATILLRSAATTQTEEALRNQNWNDHLESAYNDMGHLAHIGQRLRSFEAQWESGCELSAVVRTAPSPDELYVSVTGGVILQMHDQPFPAINTETTGYIHVVNSSTTPYTTITDLATQTSDSTGSSLGNREYSVVIWASANHQGEISHLFMNLPSGSYTSATDALEDPNNYANYTIPNDFRGVGFLIARLVLGFGGGTTTMTIHYTEDLRGKIPNISAGGGSIGGAGATTFLALTDTPSIFTGASLMAVRVNAGETALEYSSTLNLNTITEYTANAGVTIETFKIENGEIDVSHDGYLNNAFRVFDTTAAERHYFTTYRSGGSVAVPAIAPASAGIAYYRNYVYDGATDLEVASMYFTSLGTTALGSASGQIRFYTRNTTNALAEVVRITEGGSLQVNSIGERLTDAGVTVDSVELKDGGIKLATGPAVNEIETTITDEDTHIPTSGAVLDSIAAATYWSRTGVTIEPKTAGDNITTSGTITSTNVATGQSTINLGLVVNSTSSALIAADFAVNTTTYTALTVDASADSIQIMSNAAGLVGLFGAAPTAQSTGWTITNHVADKVIDANATTVDEIINVLGELITELKLKGVLGG